MGQSAHAMVCTALWRSCTHSLHSGQAQGQVRAYLRQQGRGHRKDAGHGSAHRAQVGYGVCRPPAGRRGACVLRGALVLDWVVGTHHAMALICFSIACHPPCPRSVRLRSVQGHGLPGPVHRGAHPHNAAAGVCSWAYAPTLGGLRCIMTASTLVSRHVRAALTAMEPPAVSGRPRDMPPERGAMAGRRRGAVLLGE